MTRSSPKDFGRGFAGVDVEAEPFHRSPQHRAARRVELDVEQVGRQMHDMGFAAEPVERARGLESQQAAADRHGFAAPGGVGRHRVAVVEGPVGEKASFATARSRPWRL